MDDLQTKNNKMASYNYLALFHKERTVSK